MDKITGKKYEKNARKISEKQKADLAKWLSEFGDLSGVILNTQNNQYVGGNQRSDILKDGELVIEKRFDNPDNVGTVAYGYVELNGQRFSYREVFWDNETHAKSSLVANKAGGIFDNELLKEYHENILIDSGFDDEEIQNILEQKETPEIEEEKIEPIFPIVSQFMEKYDAFVIITKDEMDYNHLCELLNIVSEKSYKNENVGRTHVLTTEKFIKEWNKSQS